jgi:hypothetical protein
MYPLGLGAGLVSVAALFAARAGPRLSWSVATGAALGIGAVTRFVNEPINQKLAGLPPLTDEDTIAAMRRWNSWNWLHLFLALIGFFAALHGLQTWAVP